MIMSAIIIASSILTRSTQTTVLSLKNYNIAKENKKVVLLLGSYDTIIIGEAYAKEKKGTNRIN